MQWQARGVRVDRSRRDLGDRPSGSAEGARRRRQPRWLVHGRQRDDLGDAHAFGGRSEEHTSELQSLMRISYAVLCLQKKSNAPYESNLLLYIYAKRISLYCIIRSPPLIIQYRLTPSLLLLPHLTCISSSFST